MADKLAEYNRGRQDGMDLALRVVKDGGIEALEREILARGRLGLKASITTKELDLASQHIKEIAIATIRIACVSILHDQFGFGQQRCQKFMDAFDKITSYLENGWAVWMDLIETIKQDMDLDLDDSRLELTGKYAHPEPEDIYTEADLVDNELWKAMLKDLHFTEESLTKTKNQINDNHGEPILQYEGQYNKIQMYDVLTGIQLARDLLGWKEAK